MHICQLCVPFVSKTRPWGHQTKHVARSFKLFVSELRAYDVVVSAKDVFLLSLAIHCCISQRASLSRRAKGIC
jgi:hypothetical protein